MCVCLFTLTSRFRAFRPTTVWSIWLATLQTYITRPADMLEICAIAYLKEFFIAFMLFFIPILTYDANSVIFTFIMKSPMPQIWRENSHFKKSEEIWTVKRNTLRLPTKIQPDFIILVTRKVIWSLLLKLLLLHHHSSSASKNRPSQRRPAHGRQSLKHQTCNLVML